MLITDEELAGAICGAVKEYRQGKFDAGILIKDIRAALREFDAQPTLKVTSKPL